MQWLETLVAEAQEQLGDRERTALWTRGMSDEQIFAYKVGYLDKYLPVAEYPTHFLEWWADQPREDVFVFPMTNTLGHLRGLQLRSVDPALKGYTDYIADKEEPVLFGLAQAVPHIWTTETICLVEGVFDLCPLQRIHPFTVATLHAGVPRNFWRTLRRLVRHIWLFYDADATGRKVSFEILREHRDQFEVKIFDYPKVPYKNRQVKDLGELWEVWGDARLGVFLRERYQLNQMEI